MTRVPREVRQRFWEAVRSGMWAADAAAVAGVSRGVGDRLVAERGGVMEPRASPSGRYLSQAEREEIAILHAQQVGIREIGRRIGRPHTTVGRELARNRNRDDESMRCCHETIYRSIYVQGRGELRRELAAHLRTGRTQRKPQHRPERRKGRLVETIHISQRPAEATDRAVPGHWEGDLILGKAGGSAIGTLVERSTRFVMLIHLPKRRTAEDFAEAVIPVLGTLPDQLRRSLTWDQGKEMALHKQIAFEADIDLFFCDPRSPWQRGTNENTNGLLRQYFPKTVSLRQFTPADLAEVARKLNSRPRETLGWATPAQRLEELLCGHPISRGATTD